MSYRFDKDQLGRRLRALPGWKGLAFGILLLERALPGYRAFEAETGVQGVVVLEGALAKAWAALRSDSQSPRDVSAFMCEGIAPDTEDYTSEWTSAALDAACIAAELMDFMEDGTVGHLVTAAGLRHDTCDMLAQGKLDLPDRSAGSDAGYLAGYIERVRSHPLVQQELAAQDGDLTLLKALDDDKIAGLSAIERRLRP